jgi:3-oxoacyl-[acyl-carrier-protein] synthase II
MSGKRRVVVTGIGMVSCLGNTAADNWAALTAGRSGIGPITKFDASAFRTQFAGEVRNFDPTAFLSPKEVKRTDTFIHFAVAAADEALADSGLVVTDENAERTGTIIGSGVGGFATIEREHTEFVEKGPSRISPYFLAAYLPNLAAGTVSIRHNLRGPNSATCTACSTGAHAVGDGFKIIQRGDADAMLCGGTEASVTVMALGGFSAMRALSPRNDEPTLASRPFDKDRDGFVLGEGAGVLMLEALDQAVARGARIYAEVVGYGMTGDAFHITQPSEDASGASRVMAAAILDAGLDATDIDYVNAHGTSTPLGDRLETLAMHKTFGEHVRHLAVSSTKSMTGHTLGAAGGIEAGILALTIAHQTIAPTINYATADPDCDLDCVPNEARRTAVRHGLSNSFGFGGTNASLVFSRFDE